MDHQPEPPRATQCAASFSVRHRLLRFTSCSPTCEQRPAPVAWRTRGTNAVATHAHTRARACTHARAHTRSTFAVAEPDAALRWRFTMLTSAANTGHVGGARLHGRKDAKAGLGASPPGVTCALHTRIYGSKDSNPLRAALTNPASPQHRPRTTRRHRLLCVVAVLLLSPPPNCDSVVATSPQLHV